MLSYAVLLAACRRLDEAMQAESRKRSRLVPSAALTCTSPESTWNRHSILLARNVRGSVASAEHVRLVEESS